MAQKKWTTQSRSLRYLFFKKRQLGQKKVQKNLHNKI